MQGSVLRLKMALRNHMQTTWIHWQVPSLSGSALAPAKSWRLPVRPLNCQRSRPRMKPAPASTLTHLVARAPQREAVGAHDACRPQEGGALPTCWRNARVARQEGGGDTPPQLLDLPAQVAWVCRVHAPWQLSSVGKQSSIRCAC